MLPACAALATSLALQAGPTEYGVSLYALGRYATSLDVLAPVADASIEIGPRIDLSHDERTLAISGAYLPRLAMAVGFPPPKVFHRASLDVVLRASQLVRFTLSGEGCYGTTDFRTYTAAGCPISGGTGTGWIASGWSGLGKAVETGAPGVAPVEPVPTITSAAYMNAVARLGVESSVSRSVEISGGASYLAQGGADAPTRTVLPLLHGPRLSVLLDWIPGPDDRLSTRLAGAYYRFLVGAGAAAPVSPGSDLWLLQLAEEWRHNLGPQALVRLALGAGAVGSAVDFARFRSQELRPVAEVAFEQGPGRSGTDLGVGLRVAPFADFTTGLAYESGTAFSFLGLALDRALRLNASLSASAALDGLQHQQVTAAGQLSLAWAVEQWASVFVGLSVHWQHAGPAFPVASFTQGSIFLGGSFTEAGRL